jgi:hypothetical protein
MNLTRRTGYHVLTAEIPPPRNPDPYGSETGRPPCPLHTCGVSLKGVRRIYSCMCWHLSQLIPSFDNIHEPETSAAMLFPHSTKKSQDSDKSQYWKITFINIVLVVCCALTVYLLVGRFGFNRWETLYEPLYLATVIAYTQLTISFKAILRAPLWQAILMTAILGIVAPGVMIVVLALLV